MINLMFEVAAALLLDIFFAPPRKKPMVDVTPKPHPMAIKILPGEQRGDSRLHYTGKSEYFH